MLRVDFTTDGAPMVTEDDNCNMMYASKLKQKIVMCMNPLPSVAIMMGCL